MPYDKRDRDSGKFTETYPLQDFLQSLESLSGQATTQEVADSVGCAYRTAYQKLVELEEEGEIVSKKIGSARLWSIDSE